MSASWFPAEISLKTIFDISNTRHLVDFNCIGILYQNQLVIFSFYKSIKSGKALTGILLVVYYIFGLYPR